MPDIGEDTDMVTVYANADQHDRWKGRADDFDMSVSGFVKAMVEAGLKKFDATVEPDETNTELREQRDDLKAELDHARDRINKLEDRLYRSDSAEIERFVERNPGTDFDDITAHLRATVPERANDHLDAMEGDSLEVHNDAYYPIPEPTQQQQQQQVGER